MGATVVTPTEIPIPFESPTAVVEIKEGWSGAWKLRPDIHVIRATATAGDEIGSATLRRRYGNVKDPWAVAFDTKSALHINGYWVRIRFGTESGFNTVWVGRIGSDTRTIYGSNETASGVQEWVAHSPKQILRRIHISRSYWYVEGEGPNIELDWVPDMNARDKRRMLVGNRSENDWAAPSGEGDTYLYGQDELWSYHDALTYLLGRFVDDSDNDGPAWRLAGQADLLKNVKDVVSWSTTQTAAEMLDKLIPRRLGFGYLIKDYDGGFEVHVYALNAEDVSFAGTTLARNPHTVRIVVSRAIDEFRTHIVKSEEHKYGKIRVIGRRIVVCCSLQGALRAGVASLVPKWDNGDEQDYKDGTGGPLDDERKHDAARRDDKFRPVYQLYGAPDDWNMDGGNAAPKLDDEGLEIESGAEFQRKVRKTLSWLPIREGYDNTVDPPEKTNDEDDEPDFMPPAVWVWDPDDDNGGESPRWVPAEELGIGVSVRTTDWGVFLSASPNHILAKEHFADEVPSGTRPKYDYERLVATIAFETDHRAAMTYEPADASGKEVLDIVASNAECWYLAPGTKVGIDRDEDGQELLQAPDDGIILRNDTEEMALIMAGAIARYHNERGRAELHFKGLLNWGHLLGQILTTVEEAGDTEMIQSPITTIEWTMEPTPMTIVRTGYT